MLDTVLFLPGADLGVALACAALVGFCIALIVPGSARIVGIWNSARHFERMARGRYIFLTGLVVLGVTATQIPLLFHMQWLMLSDLLALTFMAIAVAGMLLGGWALGTFSQMRAMDGFGRAWPALLGMIPGLNLVLWAVPSRETTEPDGPAAAKIGGGMGAAFGVVAIAGCVGLQMLTSMVLQKDPAAFVSPDAYAHAAVRAMVVLTEYPRHVGPLTDLVDVRAEKTDAIYTYELERTAGLDPHRFASAIIDTIPILCSTSLRAAFDNGAAVVRRYVGPDKTVFLEYRIPPHACDPGRVSDLYAAETARSVADILPRRIGRGMMWQSLIADGNDLHYRYVLTPERVDELNSLSEAEFRQRMLKKGCAGRSEDIVSRNITLHYGFAGVDGRVARSISIGPIDCAGFKK